MSKRLYVGNLPYSADNEMLRELFSPHGTVTDVHVASDRETGRSRGFGFVSYETDEEALAAVRAMNGASVGGRPLVVNVARERGSGPPPRTGPSGPAGRPPAPSRPPSRSGPPPGPPRGGGAPPDGPPPEEDERRARRTEPRQRRKPVRERDRGPKPRVQEDDENRGGAGNWRKWLDDGDED